MHNRTIQHSHCGRCSQCIDRRFAILSRELEHEDPIEAYAVDLMTGPRRGAIDREMALAYVRNARFFAHASASEFMARFPEIARALGEIDEPTGSALRRLHSLHQRHGLAVTEVMERALKTARLDETDPESLVSLYRAAQLGDLQATVPRREANRLRFR